MQNGFMSGAILDIDGGWRDHVAFAITAEELAGRPMASRLTAVPAPPG